MAGTILWEIFEKKYSRLSKERMGVQQSLCIKEGYVPTFKELLLLITIYKVYEQQQ
ncbi:hypothetical protein HMPREF1548_00120 [Clostridium sp. KLE 1755]|nr:hypothetical protein HMPREF1548_00120 [Clostridium sp. KLE 1755]